MMQYCFCCQRMKGEGNLDVTNKAIGYFNLWMMPSTDLHQFHFLSCFSISHLPYTHTHIRILWPTCSWDHRPALSKLIGLKVVSSTNFQSTCIYTLFALDPCVLPGHGSQLCTLPILLRLYVAADGAIPCTGFPWSTYHHDFSFMNVNRVV